MKVDQLTSLTGSTVAEVRAGGDGWRPRDAEAARGGRWIGQLK